jgi:hypothetical protein
MLNENVTSGGNVAGSGVTSTPPAPPPTTSLPKSSKSNQPLTPAQKLTEITKDKRALTWNHGVLFGKRRWDVILYPYDQPSDHIILFQNNPPKGAKVVSNAGSAFTRKQVHIALKKECSVNGWRCPSESTVYNKMKEIQKFLSNDPYEQPWSIGVCAKYNIAPHLIPALLRYLRMLTAMDENPTVAEQKGRASGMMSSSAVQSFSIRQAVWMWKLESIVSLFPKKEQPDGFGDLIFLAKEYAEKEKSALSQGLDPDTHVLDRMVLDAMDGKLTAREVILKAREIEIDKELNKRGGQSDG